ncbi:MAG: methylmalonyl-CoA mutase [Chloroflexi bacterium]|nr:methylmalonyl-CoA mutase [Chloroflexota bacterium]
MEEADELKLMDTRRAEWEGQCLRSSLEKCGLDESPFRMYTPLDRSEGWTFLGRVGWPGEYPFTAGTFATTTLEADKTRRRGSAYAGYGTAEDTNRYVRSLANHGFGVRKKPTFAFSLPTQCGYASDDPLARGEVGKVGVSIDTLRDMEVLFEDYTGDDDLDRIQPTFIINSIADILLAMYVALGEKRGIPPTRLTLHLQNDMLKEFVARGTQIFPVRPSMRLVRDSVVYCTKNMPLSRPITFCGDHMREAGATAEQTLGFAFANAIAYVQTFIDAGLDVDDFGPRLAFLYFKGSIDVYKEIALQRAARRMWAKIMRDRFKAKNVDSWRLRTDWGITMKYSDTTKQRPLNNLTRAVVCGVASLMAGHDCDVRPPFDEPLGLGHSLEALQLKRDAERILKYEAKLGDVIDPFAGSYFMENLTDEVEAEAWRIIEKVEAMGGAVVAVENGYMQQEITRSAYEEQKALGTGERVLVGVNKFLGEEELDVTIARTLGHPYNPRTRAAAENRQLANLRRIKRERNDARLRRSLSDLKDAAQDERTNLIPPLIETVKAYATVGEICASLKEVFGEYRPATI